MWNVIWGWGLINIGVVVIVLGVLSIIDGLKG